MGKKPIKKKKKKMITSEIDITSALKKAMSSIKTVSPAKSTPKMVIEGVFENGWKSVSFSKEREYPKKEIKDWNKKDLYLYINDSYRNITNQSLPGASKPTLAYTAINEMINKLTTYAKEDCSTEKLKSYIDYFFSVHCMKTMEKYAVTHKTLSWDKFILNFIESEKVQKITATRAIKIDTIVSQEELERSYKIGKIYLLKEFGIAISFQFLLVKQVDAKKYIIDTLAKIKNNGDIEEVIKSTKKYSYPEWFNLHFVDEVLTSIGEKAINLTPIANSMFDFLKQETK